MLLCERYTGSIHWSEQEEESITEEICILSKFTQFETPAG